MNVAMAIEVASIDHISEANMVMYWISPYFACVMHWNCFVVVLEKKYIFAIKVDLQNIMCQASFEYFYFQMEWIQFQNKQQE